MSLQSYDRAVRDEAGRPFVELTRRPLNPDNYQLGRQVIADVLDARAGHHDRGPWMTVPINPCDGVPREPTPVVRVDFDELRSQSFEASPVARRLRSVLVIPVVKPEVKDPSQWWLSVPVLWEPLAEDWEQFGRDYTAMRTLARLGRADDLSAARDGHGRFLMAKTNGANRKDLVRYTDEQGRQQTARKRGYYLREHVMQRVLQGATVDPAVAMARASSLEVPSDEVVAAVAELRDLDRRVEALQRTEQGHLRRALFGPRTEAACHLCGRVFTTELLVAAHIKPRAHCSLEERLDAPTVVMAACRFGCDELFERGYLAVGPEGRIITATGRLPATVQRYLTAMAGRAVLAAWPRGDVYFAWHREHVFRSQ